MIESDCQNSTDSASTGAWDETAQLVLRAQQGDQNAYGVLVERFEATVYGLALARLGNTAEAQELTQDVFLHVMSRLDQIREPERFAGWIRQVAHNLAINRRTRRVPPATCDANHLDGAASFDDNPLDRLIDRERAERLWDGLNRLKTLDRETLIAFYVDGRSLIEMSQRHDAPVGTIKRRLHIARKRLRAQLEAQDGENPWFDEFPDQQEAEIPAWHEVA
jgi:RNA polymerase sigma-70 factor (ECF subfamily)